MTIESPTPQPTNDPNAPAPYDADAAAAAAEAEGMIAPQTAAEQLAAPPQSTVPPVETASAITPEEEIARMEGEGGVQQEQKPAA
ncbi:MAG: hypothetical protein AAB436_02800 [Patescibacteria group bacterium]